MSYKTILTVASGTEPEAAVLDQAERIATEFAAHLDILCLGVDSTQQNYQYLGATVAVFPDTLNTYREDADNLAKSVRERMAGATCSWAADAAVTRLADLGRGVGTRARFCDLAVLAKPFTPGRSADAEAILEGCLFDAGVPVMVTPPETTASAHPKRIALAWDESQEALRATRAALPLLKEAEVVSVLIIDPPVHGPNRSDPGGPLSQMLARHGVNVQIDVLGKSLPRVSDVMLRHCTDFNADLVVMGAYGHSRFREALLGGATRDMLERTDVPLFMTH